MFSALLFYSALLLFICTLDVLCPVVLLCPLVLLCTLAVICTLDDLCTLVLFFILSVKGIVSRDWAERQMIPMDKSEAFRIAGSYFYFFKTTFSCLNL